MTIGPAAAASVYAFVSSKGALTVRAAVFSSARSRQFGQCPDASMAGCRQYFPACSQPNHADRWANPRARRINRWHIALKHLGPSTRKPDASRQRSMETLKLGGTAFRVGFLMPLKAKCGRPTGFVPERAQDQCWEKISSKRAKPLRL